MSDGTQGSTTSRWFYATFFVGDLLLLATAWLVYQQAHRPMVHFELAAVAGCTALGAWLAVWPFVLSHRAAQAREARADLADTLAQIQRVEEVAQRIELATSQWQTAQEHATSAVTAAREIADRMSAEHKDFKAFFEQATTAERQHLQLEVNKLRRAEGDWLQAAVRILDHVFALCSAAERSGQPRLAQQMATFQHACREAARRVGLVPLVATAGTAFDANLHQLLDPNVAAPAAATVAGTIATGYTYQGRLLRRVVVALEPAGGTAPSVALDAEDVSLKPAAGSLAATSEPIAPASPAGPSDVTPQAQELPLDDAPRGAEERDIAGNPGTANSSASPASL